MLKQLRVKLVDKLIDLNEDIFFFPNLKRTFKKHLPDGIKTAIDVGSNKGQHIDFFLKLNKNCKIYGFEPNRQLYDFLIEKYKNKPNVKIFNLGVSENKGQLIFNENVFDQTSTFEELNPNSEYLKMKSKVLGVKPEDIVVASYPVETVSLKEFIDEHVLEKEVDVMKIDTEGHEYKCMLGLFNHGKVASKVKLIQLEYHNDDMYAHKIEPETLKNLMEKNGYHQADTVKHGFGDFEEVIFKINN